MSFSVGVLLSLLASVFKAGKGITTKFSVAQTDDAYLTSWGYQMFATVAVGLGVILTGQFTVQTAAIFWIALFVTVVGFSASTLLLTKAYKVSDVSLIAPLVAFVPLATSVPAWVILDEQPTILAGVGILSITLGAYLLQLHEKETGFFEPLLALGRDRGAQYIAIFLVVVSIVPTFEKIGLQYTSPLIWVFVTYFFESITLFVVLLVVRSIGEVREIKHGWKSVALLGLITAALSLTQSYAYTILDVAYVQSIKRASLILVVLAGWLIFDEDHIKQRLIGGAVICFGIILIIIFG